MLRTSEKLLARLRTLHERAKRGYQNAPKHKVDDKLLTLRAMELALELAERDLVAVRKGHPLYVVEDREAEALDAIKPDEGWK